MIRIGMQLCNDSTVSFDTAYNPEGSGADYVDIDVNGGFGSIGPGACKVQTDIDYTFNANLVPEQAIDFLLNWDLSIP